MNSFATAKIPDWVRTLRDKYKLNDHEVFALARAYEETEYLHSFDMTGDQRHDEKIDALKKKAKALEKFGSSDYRWPKSVATIRYELRSAVSSKEAFAEAVDVLFAMKKVPRENDYGMIKAKRSHKLDLLYSMKWSETHSVKASVMWDIDKPKILQPLKWSEISFILTKRGSYVKY